MTESSHRDALTGGHRLHWYVIDKVLGQGGFGITYLARDENLHQPVAIKEYLPRDLAGRQHDDSVQPLSGEQGAQFLWGLERFISEARTLARFRHPNIVRVLTVFEENNTAYMVMEYEQGQGLHEILRERKTLQQKELEGILMPLLDGLEKVHVAGFIHRDIKPANIFIRGNGSPVLLDFGSARQALGEQTRTLTSLVSPGYAPFEQYTTKGEEKQGPWTDIYGLGATLYRAVTGRSPCDAVDRSEALLHTEHDDYVPCLEIGKGKYSDAWLRTIDHALAFRPQDRPQSIAEWRREFTAAEAPAPTVKATTVLQSRPARVVAPAPAATPTPRRSRRWLPALIALAAVLALLKLAHVQKLHPTAGSPAASAAAPASPAPPAGAEAPTASTAPSSAGGAPAVAAPATAETAPTQASQPQNPPESSTPSPTAEQSTPPDETSSAAGTAASEPQTTDTTAAEGTQGEQPNRRELSPAQIEKRRQVRQLIMGAKQAEQRGEYRRALQDVQEALKIAPNNPRLLEARRELIQQYRMKEER